MFCNRRIKLMLLSNVHYKDVISKKSNKNVVTLIINVVWSLLDKQTLIQDGGEIFAVKYFTTKSNFCLLSFVNGSHHLDSTQF